MSNLYQLAKCYQETDSSPKDAMVQAQRSIESLEDALAISPKAPYRSKLGAAYQLRGFIELYQAMRTGEYDLPIESFKNASKFSADSVHSFCWLSLAQGLGGQHNEAYVTAYRVLSTAPADPFCKATLATAHFHIGNYHLALQYFTKSFSAMGSKPPLFLSFAGLAAAELGDLESGLACCLKAVEQEGESPLFLANLGRAYLLTGQAAAAAAVFAKAREFAPDLVMPIE